MAAFVYIAVALAVFVTNTSYAQNIDKGDPAFFKINEIFWRAKAPTFKFGPTGNSVDPQSGKSISIRSTEDKKRDGGVHSGGETLVEFQKTLGVLDLYRFNRKAFFDKTPGHKLPYTKAFRQYEIDQLSKDSSIFKRAIEQVGKWSASSPYTVRFVQRALQDLPMYYVNYRLNFKVNAAELPPGITAENVKLGAWYMATFGAFVDKNAFQRLSEKNQIAFLIHEALRHEQFSHYSDYGNEAIQKLTARLVDDPRMGESLDVAEFFTYDRAQLFEAREKLIPETEAVLKSFCELAKRCDVQASQLLTVNGTEEEFTQAFATLDELMKALRPERTSLSALIRNTDDQSARDELNALLSKHDTFAMRVAWSYHGKLRDLHHWVLFRDGNYDDESRLSGLSYDYQWLPDLLKKTNKGYRYVGGTSPLAFFMKEMKSAGFFR